MTFSLPARTALDADLDRLRDEHLLVLPLADLAQLLEEPDGDPWKAHVGPDQAGIDDLAATLYAARRLPDDLTVRVVLPEGAPAPALGEAQAALQRRAAYQATVAWREGMAQRATGRAQIPLGLPLAVIAAVVAYAAAGIAANASGVWVGLFAMTAGLSITVAWVVSWMVVEAAFIDWRPGARKAMAYDLLSRASLEVTYTGREDGSAASLGTTASDTRRA